MQYNSGWVRCGFKLADIRRADVSYPFPGLAGRSSDTYPWWNAFMHAGAPRLLLNGGNKDPTQLWDLRSSTVLYSMDSLPAGGYNALPRLGVLTHVILYASLSHAALPYLGCSRVKQTLFDLATGTRLCEVDCKEKLVVTNRLLLFIESRASSVRFWDPLVPDRIAKMDFLDWRPLYHSEEIIVAERADQHLIWNLSLARGVRAALPVLWDSNTRVWYRHGTYVVRDATGVYLLVPPSDGAQLDRTAPHRTAPHPTTLPAVLPLVAVHEAYGVANQLQPASTSRDSELPLLFNNHQHRLWRCSV